MNKPKVIKIETGENIKIDPSVRHADKMDRKAAFGTSKQDFLKNITVDITKEQGDKLEQLTDYIKKFSCFNCHYKLKPETAKSNDNDELMITCPKCDSVTIDGFKESKDYVTWFNKDILADYGMSFKDGFPSLIRCRYKYDVEKRRSLESKNIEKLTQTETRAWTFGQL